MDRAKMQAAMARKDHFISVTMKALDGFIPRGSRISVCRALVTAWDEQAIKESEMDFEPLEGWVLVPREPTPEMVKAGESWSGLPSGTWSDMIDAAPMPDFEPATTFERQIAYGKRRAAELESILAHPEAAKSLEEAVLTGCAIFERHKNGLDKS